MCSSGADRLPVPVGEDEHADQCRTSRLSWVDGHHLHGNLLWKGRSRYYAVHERRSRLVGSVPQACGWGSRIRNPSAES